MFARDLEATIRQNIARAAATPRKSANSAYWCLARGPRAVETALGEGAEEFNGEDPLKPS